MTDRHQAKLARGSQIRLKIQDHTLAALASPQFFPVSVVLLLGKGDTQVEFARAMEGLLGDGRALLVGKLDERDRAPTRHRAHLGQVRISAQQPSEEERETSVSARWTCALELSCAGPRDAASKRWS